MQHRSLNKNKGCPTSEGALHSLSIQGRLGLPDQPAVRFAHLPMDAIDLFLSTS